MGHKEPLDPSPANIARDPDAGLVDKVLLLAIRSPTNESPIARLRVSHASSSANYNVLRT
jgi:hypothetical protein